MPPIDTNDTTILMPRPGPFDRATVYQSTIMSLHSRFSEFQKDEARVRATYPWADRFVMGFPLPSWQRPQEWSRQQQVRFIESIWMGIDLGTYLYNDTGSLSGFETRDGVMIAKLNTDALLDGQQRLSAIEAYWRDEISIEDANGVQRFWSELPAPEMRRFRSTGFASAVVCTLDETALRRIYDLRAFGGTPHQEHQRASLNTDDQPSRRPRVKG